MTLHFGVRTLIKQIIRLIVLKIDITKSAIKCSCAIKVNLNELDLFVHDK